MWSWLAVAGLGALHGLNPATGWMLAAAWGLRARDPLQSLRALAPLALGHLASVAMAGLALVFGMALDRSLVYVLVVALLILALALHLTHRAPVAGPAGMALWSFMMATAHGAGLVLAPALALCAANSSGASAGVSVALTSALAAVGVHMAAMLFVTGLVAALLCRGIDGGRRRLRAFRRK